MSHVDAALAGFFERFFLQVFQGFGGWKFEYFLDENLRKIGKIEEILVLSWKTPKKLMKILIRPRKSENSP